MKTLIPAIAITATLFAAQPEGDPFNGVWKANPVRCKLSGTTKLDPSRDIIKVEMTSDKYRAVYDSGREVVLALDGKPHQPGAGGLAALTGSDEYTARRVNKRTIELTYKRKGQVVLTLSRQVSPDGRVMTAKTEGTSIAGEGLSGACVYDRQ